MIGRFGEPRATSSNPAARNCAPTNGLLFNVREHTRWYARVNPPTERRAVTAALPLLEAGARKSPRHAATAATSSASSEQRLEVGPAIDGQRMETGGQVSGVRQ
jgi:hypothetical protein